MDGRVGRRRRRGLERERERESERERERECVCTCVSAHVFIFMHMHIPLYHHNTRITQRYKHKQVTLKLRRDDEEVLVQLTRGHPDASTRSLATASTSSATAMPLLLQPSSALPPSEIDTL